jgi:hypothetical protein
MLRHSNDYKLANDGQDTRSLAHYLGHRNCNRRPGTQRWRRIDFGVSGRTSLRPPRYVKPECQHAGSRAVEPGEEGTATGMRQEVDIRYVVTSLEGTAEHLYEDVYCQRGQMEKMTYTIDIIE